MLSQITIQTYSLGKDTIFFNKTSRITGHKKRVGKEFFYQQRNQSNVEKSHASATYELQ